MSDPYRLLHGPYAVPTLTEADTTTCLYRQRTVRITRWSDTPIAWPLGIDVTTGGRPSPVVDEELARAIRHERPRTVCHWWGVSMALVQRWRKTFGVKSNASRRGRAFRSLWDRPSTSRRLQTSESA